MDKDSKNLPCAEPTCVLTKSPNPSSPETPAGEGKRRNRKKKTQKDDADNAALDELTKKEDATTPGKSFIPHSIKVMGVIAVVGLGVLGLLFASQ